MRRNGLFAALCFGLKNHEFLKITLFTIVVHGTNRETAPKFFFKFGSTGKITFYFAFSDLVSAQKYVNDGLCQGPFYCPFYPKMGFLRPKIAFNTYILS